MSSRQHAARHGTPVPLAAAEFLACARPPSRLRASSYGEVDRSPAEALLRVGGRRAQERAPQDDGLSFVKRKDLRLPGVGDLVEHLGAEALGRTGNGAAAKRAIELDGGLVVGQ